MWHPHEQYAQIEPTCDLFSLVLLGYFPSSLGPSQQTSSHAGMVSDANCGGPLPGYWSWAFLRLDPWYNNNSMCDELGWTDSFVQQDISAHGKLGPWQTRPRANLAPTQILCICFRRLDYFNNINKYLALDSILADCQHGIRSQRSCETQLVQYGTISSATWMGLWIVDTSRQIWS